MSTRQWYTVRNALADDGPPEILIYDVIDSMFGVSAADFVRDLAKIDAPAITVRINSPGGAVFDGIAILNALRGHDAKITTVVDGIAASIASVIAMGGDEIVMNKNSQMMIHNAWDLVIGNADELQAAADRLRQFSENLASIYADRAGGSVADWQALMDAETWYTADEAVAAGLADLVLVETVKETAMASYTRPDAFDLSKFRYPGRQAAPAPQIAARAQAPQPVEAEVTEKTGGGHMPTLNEGLAELFGTEPDADDETILAAAKEALDERAAGDQQAEPEPVAEPTGEQITAAAAKLGLTVVDTTVLASLQAKAEAGEAARAQQLREDDDRIINDALAKGKITPATTGTWRAELAKNRDSVAVLLETMPENKALAMTEVGHAFAAEGTELDAEMEHTLAMITGNGRSNGKGA